MNTISSFWEGLRSQANTTAIADDTARWRYRDLLSDINQWQVRLDSYGIAPHQVVALQSDYREDSITLLLALLQRRCVAALVASGAPDFGALAEEAQAAHSFQFPTGSAAVYQRLQAPAQQHPLLRQLADRHSGGFVVFSSGSSGKPKAVLHDIARFLQRYREPLKRYTSLGFLQFDHIAGIDTLLYSLASGGCLVLANQRTPAAVCRAISEHRVEVLPTSPSFLNLFLLAGNYQHFDLSSLKIITYGAEPMPQATLQRLLTAFPGVRCKQKYGASEFGAPANTTRSDDSLWLKLDGGDFQTCIIDGLLWVRSSTTMLGYLNAENPMSEDGWLCTGDRVEVDGDWLRILGRDSDLINVGGEKVYPTEVEAVIQQLPAILDVAAYGQDHPMLGQIVCCRLNINDDEEPGTTIAAVRSHCLAQLPRYKVPIRIEVSNTPVSSDRQKKIRCDY